MKTTFRSKGGRFVGLTTLGLLLSISTPVSAINLFDEIRIKPANQNTEFYIRQLGQQISRVYQQLEKEILPAKRGEIGPIELASSQIVELLNPPPKEFIHTSFTPGFGSTIETISQPSRLHCHEEAMIAHHMIHEAQKGAGELDPHRMEGGIDEKCEHNASVIELAYALRFCKPTDLEPEQKSMAFAINERDEKAFEVFMDSRLPKYNTFSALLAIDFQGSRDIGNSYRELERKVADLIREIEKSDAAGSSEDLKAAYQNVQAIRFSVPSQRNEAERAAKPLFFSRSNADYRRVEDFRKTRQNLNRSMLKIENLRTKIWPKIESANLYQ